MLIVPLKLMKVGRLIVVSDDTLLLIGDRLTLTTSAPWPKSTTPLIFEPGSSVSVSAALDNLIAIPPVPVIVPEFVIVAAPVAEMPVVPMMVPALVKLAVDAMSRRRRLPLA